MPAREDTIHIAKEPEKCKAQVFLESMDESPIYARFLTGKYPVQSPDNQFSLFDVPKRKISNLEIELKQVGDIQLLKYSEQETLYGKAWIAEGDSGICKLDFHISESEFIQRCREVYGEISFDKQATQMHHQAVEAMEGKSGKLSVLVSAEGFRYQVWKQLCAIPYGQVSSYGDIAAKLGDKNASRAVGGAVGANPVAYLIPCHRVVQSDGHFGHFRWGEDLKKCMLAYEYFS